MKSLASVGSNHESSDEESEEEDDGSTSESDEDGSTSHVVTETFILLRNKRTRQDLTFRVLLDSGTRGNLGTKEAVQRAGLHVTADRRTHVYDTAAGIFSTTHRVRVRAHRLLELNRNRVLPNTKVRVTDGRLGRYDFIFGRDYMSKYGIDLIFSEGVIRWDGMQAPMKPMSTGNSNSKPIPSDELQGPASEEYEHRDAHLAQQILDSKYEKQDLIRVAKDQKHLTVEEQRQLYHLLKQYESLFSGQLGLWNGNEVSLTLTKDAVPYHCMKPIRVAHAHQETLQKEVDRLISIGVLEVVNAEDAGPWCAPSFIIAKKDGRVRFITDYRKLNQCLQRRPWPMPHIADLIQDIGAYTYVTALDLSMGYYHMVLDKDSSRLTQFMLPSGIYRYKRLAMGLSVSPDIFQERIAKTFADLPFVKCYLDDLLVFSNGSYEDHLKKVNRVLQRLQAKGLAVNALKSFWAVKEVDYLGFRLTPQGIMPQERKVKAILNMVAPRNKKELRHFIGLVNYYRFMWRKRSHILSPLAALSSPKVPFKWTPEAQQAFEEMKRVVAKEVLLSFPDYTKRFEIHIDASDRQLGAVLKQGDKTLAFFSKKLKSAEKNYGVGEKEMLSAVEALKEFRTMILGYPIDIYTDHKNWTYGTKAYKNDRITRWRLIIEEFAPTLHYVQGSKNVVADALSRLPFKSDSSDDDLFFMVDEAFDMASWRQFIQPLTIREIQREQAKDKYVKQVLQQAPDRLGELFEDIGQKAGPDRVLTETNPVDRKLSRIIVPQSLTRRLIKWYHAMLVHPGAERLYNTLRQHYTWPNMAQQIKNYTKQCHACQVGKRGLRGMGKIPLKDVETEPWKDVAIDLAGPWKTKIDGKEIVFHTFTIIDTFTGWVEIVPIYNKEMETIGDAFKREWLRRYPRPSRVTFDAGNEFNNEYFTNLLALWYVNHNPVTVKNPRANAIIERMHLVLGNMIRCQLAKLHKEEDIVSEITSAAAFAMRATVHGTTRFTPAQLVFSKDMILRTHMEANMELVRQRREAAIFKANQRENKRRIAYSYKPGDKILILSGGYLEPKLKLHEGPYKVLGFNKSNGTLTIRRRNYIEPINIRNVRPYFGKKKALQ